MLTNTKVTFEELYKHVAGPPGDAVISELQRSLKWSVVDFVNDGHWKFEPLTDATVLPPEARHRMELIEGTGVNVEWVLAHEIDYKPVTLPEVHISEEDEEMVGKVLLVALGVVAVVALLPFVLFGLALMAFACSSGDPQLIAVVTNGKGEKVWKSCYRWYSEH
jgi:hypothetical protein